MRLTRRILCIAGVVALAAACNRSPAKAFDRGVAYFHDEKFAKAADCFETAVHSGTPTAQAWNFLGVCRLQTGDTAGAIKAFQACLELDPNHAPAHYNLALAYLETNQPAQAIPLLRYLAQGGQCPPSVYYQLGRALVATDAWTPAKQAFAKLTDADANADIQNSLGVIETHLGDFKQAKTYFENAAALDPNVPAVYLNLATLEQHYLGQKAAAVQHYRKFLELVPKSEQHEDIRLTITQLTQEAARPVEPRVIEPPAPAPAKPIAAQDLPAIEKVEPKPTVVVVPAEPPRPVIKRRTPVTVTSLQIGNRTKATPAFNEGITAQQKGKLNAAIAAYGHAVSLDPAYAQAYYNRAIAEVDLRLPDKALDDYELALVADPDFTNARYNYAIILQKQGYLVDAVAQYEKLLEKNPNDVSLHLIAASLYARDPQTKAKARQHYQAIQRLAPDTPAGRDARNWLQNNP